jgi:predicted NAD-dependent protein-ADP-ribosyltransferase YbiA (DUF1768 family)
MTTQEHAYLSNMYVAWFTDGNYDFHSSEQYYAWRKANACGDTDRANLILKTRTPVEARRLANELIPWKSSEERELAMLNGVALKFSQNPPILRKLLDLCATTLMSNNHVNEQNIVGHVLLRARESLMYYLDEEDPM